MFAVVTIVLVLALLVTAAVRFRRPLRGRSRTAVNMDAVAAQRAETDVRSGHVGGGWTIGGL